MKLGTTRVEAFSDGVMSIIITIMVIAFKLPDFEKEGTHISVRHHLFAMLPMIVTYSFSFMMVGIFWINHHHMFHLLQRTDEALLVQNLFFLFCMSFVPVATAFVGSNPLIEESVAFYGLVMLLTTLAFAVMRSHSIKKKLLHRDRDKTLTAKVYRVSIKARTKTYIGTIAYLASIPLAFYNVYFSFACFAVPPILFFIPDGIDDEALAERILEKN
jgi:uncharacterized membrane protein